MALPPTQSCTEIARQRLMRHNAEHLEVEIILEITLGKHENQTASFPCWSAEVGFHSEAGLPVLPMCKLHDLTESREDDEW